MHDEQARERARAAGRRRAAEFRRRRREALVWSAEHRGMVWPQAHAGSDSIYKSTGCQCRPCLAAHALAVQLDRNGDLDTKALSLDALGLASLRELATLHLTARTLTIPPPPPAVGVTSGRPRGRHRARAGHTRDASDPSPPARPLAAAG